ncbi:hypothetical protein DES39_0609 [Orbus hercynius]|uniref:Uncharacterized protein n=1 Tax=Orbus hercynius TaxID=593135 RepID=A0A495RIW5_9GAMM|nr:hypothetical protein [Orbus hercynius]RKS87385.1 hypothetical protein DES39_0609 [Orbus hercynius]
MKKVTIEKFVQGTLDESFTVPVAFIRTLNALLPHFALQSLNEKGFNLEQIMTAHKQNTTYQAETEVNEKGIDKKVVIQLK